MSNIPNRITALPWDKSDEKHVVVKFTIIEIIASLRSINSLFYTQKELKNVVFFCSAQVWSIFYRGWLTLMMLLWATITWIYLNTRRNIIVVLIFAVGVLFVEYLYVVLGDEVLRKLHRSDSDRWSLYTPDDFPTAIFVKVNTKRSRQRNVVYSVLKTNG